MRLTQINLRLPERFEDAAYFHAFFAARMRDDIAMQIRGARLGRNLTQSELAKLSSMKQSAISRIERADYGRLGNNTLLRIAKALDMRVSVEFKSRSDVIAEYLAKQ